MSAVERADFAATAAANGALLGTTALALAWNAHAGNWVPAGVQLLSLYVAWRLWRARNPPVPRSLRLLVALQLFSTALASSGLHLGRRDSAVAASAVAAGVPLLTSFALRPSHAAAAVAVAAHALAFVGAMLLGAAPPPAVRANGAAALPVLLPALLSIAAVFLIGSAAPKMHRLSCVVLSAAALAAQVPVPGAPATLLLDAVPALLLCAAALVRSPPTNAAAAEEKNKKKKSQ